MRLVIFAAAALGLCCVSPTRAAEVFGVWVVPSHEAHVQIEPCGQAICGKLIGSTGLTANPALKDTKNHDPALRGRPLMGSMILTDFRGGPKKWQGGKIYNAENGDSFAATLELTSPNTLKLTACVVAPLCKTQVWVRLRP
jgi:uncharacterized protein (DUF2147 family)